MSTPSNGSSLSCGRQGDVVVLVGLAYERDADGQLRVQLTVAAVRDIISVRELARP